uniref:GG16503 n=1 Tax=Drosophila erecta TaxID=7220 RepID=B3P022_DROER
MFLYKCCSAVRCCFLLHLEYIAFYVHTLTCFFFSGLGELDPSNLADFGNESFLPKTQGTRPQNVRCGLASEQKCVRTLDDWDRIRYDRTKSGDILLYDGYRYDRRASYNDIMYWGCAKKRLNCNVYMITHKNKPTYVAISGVHNHL